MNVRPRTQFFGEFRIPGDKSVTHRAILFNGIARGEAVVTDAAARADCLSSAACMRALGAQVEVDGTSIRVRGAERLRAADCDCGNSGTTMRLLMGLAAGQGVQVRLTGDASLSRRPMERVAAPLRLLGADIETADGHAPRPRAPRAPFRPRGGHQSRQRAGQKRAHPSPLWVRKGRRSSESRCSRATTPSACSRRWGLTSARKAAR